MERVLMLGWDFPPKMEGGLDVHVSSVFEHLENTELALPERNCPEGERFHGIETGDEDMVERARQLSGEFVELAEDFDVVHTHDWIGAEAGRKAQKYAGTHWVSTMHSTASGRNRRPSHRIERLERAAVELPDAVIAVSQRLAEKLKEKYDRDCGTVRNAVSVPETGGRNVRAFHGIGEGADLVLYVGRLAEQKSVELLVKAVKDLDVELLVVGTGHRREALEKLVEILEVEQKVQFAGFVESSVLGDYYEAADVFVSPSRSEPFGLTVTEALVSGTPVVSTGSGASEVVESGITRVGRNSGSIAEGIEEALEDPPEVSMHERNWSEVAKEYRQVYSRVRSSTESISAG